MLQYAIPFSVLISLGETFSTDMRKVDAIEAIFVDRFDSVEVKLGHSRLVLTFADAADLVDKVTQALDAHTSTLRVVA
ncbi:hypothetical protein [Nocardia salmonicida]|uniref:hypothetical protein n=1 Tax=Nocardia salmonicida TaxID=53431 RepID=UPI0007A40DB8|nr:hypothetical protein [Nocardia salmonicida]